MTKLKYAFYRMQLNGFDESFISRAKAGATEHEDIQELIMLWVGSDYSNEELIEDINYMMDCYEGHIKWIN